MTAREVLDDYFLETRARLLEIAANLDRLDRAAGAAELAGDPRLGFIREALGILQSRESDRAARIQILYSKQ